LNKTEKTLSSIFTIALGVLLIVMKGEMISVFMTVLGIALISLGVIELLRKEVASAVVKIGVGALIVFLGWVLVSAIVYLLATMALILGVVTGYDCIRCRLKAMRFLETVCLLIPSLLCVLIGVILFFNSYNWCFIVAGVLTVILGGFLFGIAVSEK
jgi:hypothetical protein